MLHFIKFRTRPSYSLGGPGYIHLTMRTNKNKAL